MSRSAPPRRPGFVLLLTVVLLALVAAGLAGVARRSHRASLDANRLEAELQRRWLARTAENLLPHVGEWFDTRSRGIDPSSLQTTGSAEPLACETIRLDLGHHQIQLVLGDEQAKFNLNAAWDEADPAVGRAKVRQLCADLGLPLVPQLRPLNSFQATAANSDHDWPAFGTYEQLIPTPPGSLASEAERSRGRWVVAAVGPTNDGRAALADHLTFWGDGRLRIDRASAPALHAALAPLLSPSQIEQILLLRGEGLDGLALLDALELTDRQRRESAGRIAADSQTFSVRLHLDDGRRLRTSLSVSGSAEDSDSARFHRLNW